MGRNRAMVSMPKNRICESRRTRYAIGILATTLCIVLCMFLNNMTSNAEEDPTVIDLRSATKENDIDAFYYTIQEIGEWRLEEGAESMIEEYPDMEQEYLWYAYRSENSIEPILNQWVFETTDIGAKEYLYIDRENGKTEKIPYHPFDEEKKKGLSKLKVNIQLDSFSGYEGRQYSYFLTLTNTATKIQYKVTIPMDSKTNNYEESFTIPVGEYEDIQLSAYNIYSDNDLLIDKLTIIPGMEQVLHIDGANVSTVLEEVTQEQGVLQETEEKNSDMNQTWNQNGISEDVNSSGSSNQSHTNEKDSNIVKTISNISMIGILAIIIVVYFKKNK